MTIKPGEEWGADTTRRPDAPVAATDHDLAAALQRYPDAEVVLTGGDLWRTFGSPGPSSPARRYPIDLVDVRLAGGTEHIAVAHVVARLPWWAGGWLRGPVVVAMNAEFLGDWELAPRGHPNDGRLETFELDPSLPVRQRLAIGRRLPTASHLPHPAIAVRPARRRSWTFDRPLHVWIDGIHHGRTQELGVTARPDAAHVVL